MTKFWGKLTLLKLLHKNKTMDKIPVFKYARKKHTSSQTEVHFIPTRLFHYILGDTEYDNENAIKFKTLSHSAKIAMQQESESKGQKKKGFRIP